MNELRGQGEFHDASERRFSVPRHLARRVLPWILEQIGYDSAGSAGMISTPGSKTPRRKPRTSGQKVDKVMGVM